MINEIKGVKESRRPEEKKQVSSIIRIVQTDIPGDKKILTGLTYIKGVGWGVSNAICKILKMDPNKKVENLTKEEIDEITKFLENIEMPNFLYNRKKDFETGKNLHLITAKLDMAKEFDIRRLKKIRSYRGLRHALGQPTRGQRTKSHFRAKGKKAIGVKRKGK